MLQLAHLVYKGPNPQSHHDILFNGAQFHFVAHSDAVYLVSAYLQPTFWGLIVFPYNVVEMVTFFRSKMYFTLLTS